MRHLIYSAEYSVVPTNSFHKSFNANRCAWQAIFQTVAEEWKTNLMSLAILFHFLCAQHASDINISIIRSLRLCCWITTSVVLFSFRCVLEIWCGWVWVVFVLQAEACKTNTVLPLQYSATQMLGFCCCTRMYCSWPLVPKFAGSNPAEAVGFLGRKKFSQHAFLRRGSKAVGPMS